MAKTYVVTPNYNTRPPPSLQNLAESSVSEANEGDKSSTRPPSTVGSLFLGDILIDPLGSELTVVNRRDRLNIPQDLLALPPDVKEGFRASRRSLLKGRVGVWATLLAALGLPLGVEMGVALERNSDDMISAEQMETQEMEVDKEFIERVVNLTSVQAHLEGCSDPPPALYIVTGLKIVYGAGAKSETTASIEASVGAQLPSQDALKILEFTRSRSEGQEFDSSTPFVLAFRARKILYKKGKWEHSLLKKGASMMDGSVNPKDSECEISGVGEDVIPDPESVEYEEVLRQNDEEAGIEWIIQEA